MEEVGGMGAIGFAVVASFSEAAAGVVAAGLAAGADCVPVAAAAEVGAVVGGGLFAATAAPTEDNIGLKKRWPVGVFRGLFGECVVM